MRSKDKLVQVGALLKELGLYTKGHSQREFLREHGIRAQQASPYGKGYRHWITPKDAEKIRTAYAPKTPAESQMPTTKVPEPTPQLVSSAPDDLTAILNAVRALTNQQTELVEEVTQLRSRYEALTPEIGKQLAVMRDSVVTQGRLIEQFCVSYGVELKGATQ